MCCMCLLVGSPKILVHMIGIGGWLHLKSCWVHTHDKELFCRRLVTGDKTWIYYWGPLSKLEFMQWKDVDSPTFTRICNSAINWLDNGSGILITDYLHPKETTTGQYHSESTFKLLSLIKQNSDESCQLTFYMTAPAQKSMVAQQAPRLRISSSKPSCLQFRLGSQ